MPYGNSIYNELFHPIVENDLNEYIMITKMSVNQNDLVSD
jgi:hypothetical protein